MAVSEEKRRKGKAARDKGARRERELRDILRSYGFTEVTRGFVWNNTSDLIGLKETFTCSEIYTTNHLNRKPFFTYSFGSRGKEKKWKLNFFS